MVDFGIRLAKLREKKRLSQSQLAERLGITKSMVSAYENSARMPSYAVLLRIAGMFNVSLDYLLGMENQVTFRTEGLSESQIAIIMDIIEEFKKQSPAITGQKRGLCPRFSLSKNPGVDKGPQPLMFNPALTTCASERMKTQRFSYFADFAARERMREANP